MTLAGSDFVFVEIFGVDFDILVDSLASHFSPPEYVVPVVIGDQLFSGLDFDELLHSGKVSGFDVTFNPCLYESTVVNVLVPRFDGFQVSEVR